MEPNGVVLTSPNNTAYSTFESLLPTDSIPYLRVTFYDPTARVFVA